MNLTTEYIKQEFRRCDRIMGTNIAETLPVKIVRLPNTRTVGCTYFSSDGLTPTRFMFNSYYTDIMSEMDCVDAIRHEHAHAAAALVFKYTGQHGEPWKKVCRMVGCRAELTTYNMSVAETLEPSEVPDEKKVRVKCRACGDVTLQGEDSRIVKVLRMGLSSWNARCKKCGGMDFKLLD